jgi:glycopeptide antibiotics resistance protein
MHPTRDAHDFMLRNVALRCRTEHGFRSTDMARRGQNQSMVDVNNVNAIRFAIGLSTILLFGSIWLGIVAFLRAKKKKSFVYLLFFTIFYIYLYKVLDYILFQFQSLLVLKHFLPDLRLNGVTAGESINLIPLITLTTEDLRTSLLNILLMVPFGFGLPFITNFRVKRIVVTGALFSIAIELLQLITGLTAKMTFRINAFTTILTSNQSLQRNP